MSELCISHTDMDGTGLAMMAKDKYPKAEVKYCGYDTIDDVVSEATAGPPASKQGAAQ